MIGNSDNKINFPHELVLANTRGANLRKAFSNNSSSKIQLSKMMQLGGFLRRLLSPLLKAGLPLMKNVVKTLAKSVLIPMGLTAIAAADAGIH